MKKLRDEVDYKNLNFKYVDKRNADVSFYGYKNSKELFNIIKNDQINFDDALKRQNEFLNKLNNIKIGNKNLGQKKWLLILKNFIFLEQRFLIFLENMEK